MKALSQYQENAIACSLASCYRYVETLIKALITGCVSPNCFTFILDPKRKQAILKKYCKRFYASVMMGAAKFSTLKSQQIKIKKGAVSMCLVQMRTILQVNLFCITIAAYKHYITLGGQCDQKKHLESFNCMNVNLGLLVQVCSYVRSSTGV